MSALSPGVSSRNNTIYQMISPTIAHVIGRVLARFSGTATFNNNGRTLDGSYAGCDVLNTGSTSKIRCDVTPNIHSSKYTSNGTVGGLCWFTPCWGTFSSVVRYHSHARDFPVLCGQKLPCCLTFSILIRTGMGIYAAPKQSPNDAFLSVRYRVTCTTAEHPVVIKMWV